MSFSLEWNNQFLEPIIILLVSTISYLIYHYFLSSESFEKRLINKYDGEKAQTLSVHYQRISGGLILGIIPSIALILLSKNLYNYGLNLNNVSISIVFVFILILLLIPILNMSSKSPEQQKLYPQIRKKIWTKNDFKLSSFTWLIYLLGYEYMFRGTLLFTLTYAFGVWPAIIITTCIYSIVHINKTAGETIGCIPIGIIFASISLYTGSFFAPFFTHVLIGILSEHFGIKNNSSIKIV